MDNKGSSTIEIGVALVIIVVIFAVMLNSSQIATQKVSETEENQKIEVMLAEITDYLINNPGDDKWVEYKKTPGLAIVNEGGETIPNSVSYTKLLALGSDYSKFVDEKIFGGKMKSSIELIPQKSTISSVKLGHGDESKNVYSQNRLVKCDFFKGYVIKDFQNPGKCNHNHDSGTHSCNYFKIFKGNLKKADYYILIDGAEKYSCKYFFDTSGNKNFGEWNTVESEKIYLNDKLDFYNTTSEIVFIHFDKKDVRACLVGVPKNFDKKNLKYDYFRTNDCELIIRAWY